MFRQGWLSYRGAELDRLLGGNSLPQICAVSGHSLQGAHTILKHDLALHPEMATTAIGNLVTW